MVDIINHSQLTWPPAWPAVCRRLVGKAFKILNLKKWDIAITLVRPEVIKKLNQRYRHQSKITDVLSFTYENKNNYLNGEIIICLGQAKLQALRREHSLARELNILVTHGLMHLGGYDHQTKKQRKQMQVLENKVLLAK